MSKSNVVFNAFENELSAKITYTDSKREVTFSGPVKDTPLEHIKSFIEYVEAFAEKEPNLSSVPTAYTKAAEEITKPDEE